jgi:hypothetical protein
MSCNIFARSAAMRQFFLQPTNPNFAAEHWKKFELSVGTEL